MIIKGGDVQQLIETPYAQPYIQIVSRVRPFMAKGRTNFILAAVLQRHTEYSCEHCLDGINLRSLDLWNHQPSNHVIATAVVVRSRQWPAVEPIFEPRSARYADMPFAH